MEQGRLRQEFEHLEADLAKGVPLREALAARRLPEFYVKMVQAGAQSNDLPGMLTLLANYYQKLNNIWVRLKGLMVYPAIVLAAALALSVFFALFIASLSEGVPGLIEEVLEGMQVRVGLTVSLWLPALVIAVIGAAFMLVYFVPAFRRSVRWRLPGFKEAGLSQVASMTGLMLESGTNLNSALGLLHDIESGTPAGAEIARAIAPGRRAREICGNDLRQQSLSALVLLAGVRWRRRPRGGISSGGGDLSCAGALSDRDVALRGVARLRLDAGDHDFLPIVSRGANIHPDGKYAGYVGRFIMSGWISHLFVWLAWLIAFGPLLWLLVFLLSLPMLRQERARFFLDLLETGWKEGRSAENTIRPYPKARTAPWACDFISWQLTWKWVCPSDRHWKKCLISCRRKSKPCSRWARKSAIRGGCCWRAGNCSKTGCPKPVARSTSP